MITVIAAQLRASPSSPFPRQSSVKAVLTQMTAGIALVQSSVCCVDADAVGFSMVDT